MPWRVLLPGVVLFFCSMPAALAQVTDLPIVDGTRIDSYYTTDNYFGQNIKIIRNAVDHDAGSEVRGLIALPQLPPNLSSLSPADLYSVKIWMCQTYYEGPSNENPYTRGVTLYPLTQSYDLTWVTWDSCNGGQWDASNPIPWSPAPGITTGVYGTWWCSWDVTSLWNNSNLWTNGAIMILDPETPPTPPTPNTGVDWVTKYFAGTGAAAGYQPFVEVVQMDQWNDLSGNWSTTANWSTGTPPNGMDAMAGFLGKATQDRTVTVDSPVTVGTILFDNAAYSYTLAGSGGNSITMSSLSGTAAITVNHGTHQISAPIVLASNTTVTVANLTDTLTLSGDISGTGTGLTLEGSGTLVLSGNNTYDSGTFVNGGLLAILDANALPAGGSLSIGTDGSLVLGDPALPEFGGIRGGRQLAGPLASGPVGGGVSAVPEPGTLALLAAAAACGFAAWRRRVPRRKVSFRQPCKTLARRVCRDHRVLRRVGWRRREGWRVWPASPGSCRASGPRASRPPRWRGDPAR